MSTLTEPKRTTKPKATSPFSSKVMVSQPGAAFEVRKLVLTRQARKKLSGAVAPKQGRFGTLVSSWYGKKASTAQQRKS